MYVGLSLGFSCTRSGLLLPFLSLCFFWVFLLVPKSPYFCPVCPPVNIVTIGISFFVVSFLCILCVRHGRILVRNTHLCPSYSNSRDVSCPQVPPSTFPPINVYLGHPLPSPTHYARHECGRSFWHILPCAVYCACEHALFVCLRVLGCFSFVYVLTLTLNPFAHVVVIVLAFDSLVR